MLNWSRKNAEQQAADTIYAVIVAQARHPGFYEKAGVPDSVDGRFELLILHAFLYFYRLKGEDNKARSMGQMVFDTMFSDLDHNLREMGVGDMSIGKKVRKMSSAFYGRTSAYDDGLEVYASQPEVLAAAVNRNMFADGGGDQSAVEIAAYMQACVENFRAQETSSLLEGRFTFAQPEWK